MLKVLVGLAAVAVIAFVGYFFWGEWQRGKLVAEQRGGEAMGCATLALSFEQASKGLYVFNDETGAKRDLASCKARGLIDPKQVDFLRGLNK